MISVRFFQARALCVLGHLDLENNWNEKILGEEVPSVSSAVFLVAL